MTRPACSAARASSRSFRRAPSTTRAPAPTSSIAVARPMPALAPVIAMTWSCNDSIRSSRSGRPAVRRAAAAVLQRRLCGDMPAEFIYTTYRLARHYPPDRTVLEDISLSFYPGAKIGVIGPNGAGKSSLLRIMAGLDDGFTGDARLTPGFTVGYLPQEPQLDPAKDVKGNVMDGVAEVQALLDAVQRRDGEVVRAGRRLRGDRRGAVRPRGPDQRRRRLERRAQRRHRDGGAPLPAGRRGRRDADAAASSDASRSRGCSSSTPTCCSSTSRRTTSTPSRSTGWSASSTSTAARSSR